MEQLGLISCASRFLSSAEPTYRLYKTVLIQQQGPSGDFNSLETIQPTSCCQQYHIRPMVCHLFLVKKKFLNKHSVTH